MITFLRRQAFLRGVLGGRRPWATLWMALVAVRFVRRFTNPQPKVVYREELHPGQALVIRREAQPGR